MKSLGDIFSSKARSGVLKVLVEMREGVGVRQAARLAGLYPRSAELALERLLEEGLAGSRRIGNRKVYHLNREHEDIPVIEAVVEAASRARIQARCGLLQQRSRAVLPFIEDALAMVTHAKRSRHAH